MLPSSKTTEPGPWVGMLASVANAFAFYKTVVEISIPIVVPSLAYLANPVVMVPGPQPTSRMQSVFLIYGRRKAASDSAVRNWWVAMVQLEYPCV
jgi:hypothetical protein